MFRVHLARDFVIGPMSYLAVPAAVHRYTAFAKRQLVLGKFLATPVADAGLSRGTKSRLRSIHAVARNLPGQNVDVSPFVLRIANPFNKFEIHFGIRTSLLPHAVPKFKTQTHRFDRKYSF